LKKALKLRKVELLQRVLSNGSIRGKENRREDSVMCHRFTKRREEKMKERVRQLVGSGLAALWHRQE
jgi:hypothetical protein